MKTVFFALLWSSCLFGAGLIKINEFSLKKDQTKKIVVQYGASQKKLTFRWTLYKNDGLVVFSSYDEVVSQHILYTNYKNQSLKIMLKPKGAYEFSSPYMLIRFDEFLFAKNKAKFSLWLNDNRQEIYIKYLKNKN